MSAHEDERDLYFLPFLQMGLPPSEVDRMTLAQFEIARRWVDEHGKGAPE